jgi:hypothetical protein
MVLRGWLSLAMLCAFGLTSLAGCGIRRIPVSGTVTLDGQPFTGGFMEFRPDNAKGNMGSFIAIGAIVEGHYNVETRAITRSDTGDGVPLGWYKVTFGFYEESTSKRRVVPPNVNPRFKSAATTPFAVEVKDDPEPGVYDYKLTK